MLYPFIAKAGFFWMMPIISLSFFALAFCLERSYYWGLYFAKSRSRKDLLKQVYAHPFDRKNVLSLCQKSQDQVIIILGRFLSLYENVNLAIAERKVYKIAEAEVQESRRFLDILGLISSISGTLGLMGTVVGISLSFENLANEDPKGLAISLSTAMYTTIGGIILFLLSYVFLFFFQKFSDQFENLLEINIHQVKDLLETQEKSKMIFNSSSNNVMEGKEKEISLTPESPQKILKRKTPNSKPT